MPTIGPKAVAVVVESYWCLSPHPGPDGCVKRRRIRKRRRGLEGWVQRPSIPLPLGCVGDVVHLGDHCPSSWIEGESFHSRVEVVDDAAICRNNGLRPSNNIHIVIVVPSFVVVVVVESSWWRPLLLLLSPWVLRRQHQGLGAHGPSRLVFPQKTILVLARVMMMTTRRRGSSLSSSLSS